jgi:penicillin-binding protein 1A
VAVNTLEMIGTGYSYTFAKEKLGLTSMIDSYTRSDGEVMSDEDYAPLALGAQTKGLTVREMASAFAVFPGGGTYREGRTYTKVYDSNGDIVLDNTQDSWEAFSAKTVNYMHYCLAAAVGGTGGNARISGQNVYGKTGTTSSNRDRWFCGYTSYYTAAVWFGFDSPEEINLVMGNGNNPAGVLFSKVLTKVHEGLPKVQLIDYSKFTGVTMCLDSGKVATAACSLDVRTADNIARTGYANVYPEDRPRGQCTKHVLVDYCVTGGGVCTEYCKLFAAEKDTTGVEVKIEQKALVKMTQKELDELVKAKASGLRPEHLRDDYIYLINEDGTDAVFKGVEGNLVQLQNAPYLVCSEHTKEAWEAYQASVEPTEPETQPEDDGAVG